MKLYAGPVEILYDNGFLRYFICEGAEVLRMVYFALRDENWGTYPLHIQNEIIKYDSNSFEIKYDGFHTKNEMQIFKWRAFLRGEPNGEVTFEIKGEALQDVLKNRVGFCVLHPTHSCAGQPLEIIRDDGKISTNSFPVNIAPSNPFKNIKQLRWKIDCWYSLSFDGDVFETEDQRNWTDASFKTFCTPLDVPFPVLLKKGSEVHQRIVFHPETVPKPNPAGVIRIHVSNQKIKFPSIGISDRAFNTSVEERIHELIATLKLSHYRVEVKFNETWVLDFSDACVRASNIRLPLEVVLHISDNFQEEVSAFSILVTQNRVTIKYLILLHTQTLTTTPSVIAFIPEVKEFLPHVKIGIGTDFNFTELNRSALAPGHADFITYSIHPQEHAFDDKSLIENLEAQRDTVLSAKVLFTGSPIHISPVTLRKRYNPYATDAKQKNINEKQRIDPRQITSFCAVWTLGSIKQLIESQAAAITYYDVVGLLGIISSEGNPFPVYNALRTLFSIQSDFVYASKSNTPLLADGIFFDNKKAIIWNYTNENQEVWISEAVAVILKPYEIKIMNNAQ